MFQPSSRSSSAQSAARQRAPVGRLRLGPCPGQSARPEAEGQGGQRPGVEADAGWPAAGDQHADQHQQAGQCGAQRVGQDGQLVPGDVGQRQAPGQPRQLAGGQRAEQGVLDVQVRGHFVDAGHGVPRDQDTAQLAWDTPRAAATRLASTLHRATMARPIRAWVRLPLADSTARTLPPAVIH